MLALSDACFRASPSTALAPFAPCLTPGWCGFGLQAAEHLSGTQSPFTSDDGASSLALCEGMTVLEVPLPLRLGLEGGLEGGCT